MTMTNNQLIQFAADTVGVEIERDPDNMNQWSSLTDGVKTPFHPLTDGRLLLQGIGLSIIEFDVEVVTTFHQNRDEMFYVAMKRTLGCHWVREYFENHEDIPRAFWACWYRVRPLYAL